MTGAHRAHRAHNKTTNKDHTDSDATKEVILDIWPEANLNKIAITSDISDTDSLTPKLDLKHTQAAVVRTNEDLLSDDLASEDDS